MQLKIKYGKECEIRRIKFTLSKLEWYKANGYKPVFPNSVKSEEDIQKFVEKEFKPEDYENAKKSIEKQWASIEKDFSDKLKKEYLELPREVGIILTKYGVGGSYSPPSRVILNIQGNQVNKPIINILRHEIIHLLLENDVRKGSLTHEQKEKLVKSMESKTS